MGLLSEYLADALSKHSIDLQQAKADEEAKRLAAARAAADTALSGGFSDTETAINGMPHPSMFPVQGQPNPLALLSMLMGGNISSMLSGNQDYRKEITSGLDTQQATREANTRANVNLANEDLATRNRLRMELQMKRLDRMAATADAMDKPDDANKYSKEAAKLHEQITQRDALQVAGVPATAHVEGAQIAAGVDLAHILAGQSKPMNVTDYNQLFEKTLVDFGKAGKEGDINTLRSSLAFMKHEGQTSDAWLIHLLSLRQRPGMFDPGTPIFKPGDPLLRAAGMVLFPEEAIQHTDSTTTDSTTTKNTSTKNTSINATSKYPRLVGGNVLPPGTTLDQSKTLIPHQLMKPDTGAYAPLVEKHTQGTGIDPAIVYATIAIESSGGTNTGWRPEPALGDTVGSIGPMQVLNTTANDLGLPSSKEALAVPDTNIKAGITVLQQKYALADTLGFTGRKRDEFAIAAYNAGVPRILSNGKFKNQGYVDKVMAALDAIRGIQARVPNIDTETLLRRLHMRLKNK